MERKRISQKITAVLLALSILLTATIMPNLDEFRVFADVIATAGWADDYDDKSLFFIENEADLAAFSAASESKTFQGKTVYLSTDVTLTQPLFNSTKAFEGTFNGNGYTITINTPVSIFGNMSGATVENLNINLNVSTGGTYGAICSSASSNRDKTITVRNCFVKGNIDYNSQNTSSLLGGFFAAVSQGEYVFDSCISTVNISSTNASALGGFIGHIDLLGSDNYSVSFINCVSGASLSSTGSSPIGGFVGKASNYSNPVLFENCLSAGELSSAGGSAIGGFIGYTSYNENVNVDRELIIRNSLSTAKASTSSTSGGFIGNTTYNKLCYPIIEGSYYNIDYFKGAVKNSDTCSVGDNFSDNYSSSRKNTGYLTCLSSGSSSYLSSWSYASPITLDPTTREAFYPLPEGISASINYFSELIGDDGEPLKNNYVSTAQELAALSGKSGKYILTSDITIPDNFTPITNFTGDLYGNSYTIINNKATSVFESVNGAYISGLTLKGNTSSAFIGTASNASLMDCVNYTNGAFVASLSSGGSFNRCASYKSAFVSTLNAACILTNCFCVSCDFITTNTNAFQVITTNCWHSNDTSFAVDPLNTEWSESEAVSQTVSGKTYISIPTLSRLYCEPVIVTEEAPNLIKTKADLEAAITNGGEYLVTYKVSNSFTAMEPTHDLTLHFDNQAISVNVTLFSSIPEGVTVTITDLTVTSSDCIVADPSQNLKGTLILENVNYTNQFLPSPYVQLAIISDEETTSEETTPEETSDEETTSEETTPEETSDEETTPEETSDEEVSVVDIDDEPAAGASEPPTGGAVIANGVRVKDGTVYYNNTPLTPSDAQAAVNYLNNGDVDDSTEGVWTVKSGAPSLPDFIKEYTAKITLTKPVSVSTFGNIPLTQTYKTSEVVIDKATDSNTISSLTYTNAPELSHTSEIPTVSDSKPTRPDVEIITTDVTLINGETVGEELIATVGGSSDGLVFECMSSQGEGAVAKIGDDGKVYPLNEGKTRIKVSYPQTQASSTSVAYINVTVETGVFEESDFYINGAPISDSNNEVSVTYTGSDLTDIISAPDISGVSFSYRISGSGGAYNPSVAHKNVTSAPLEIEFKASRYGFEDYVSNRIILVNIVKADSLIEYTAPSSTVAYTGTPITLSPSVTLLGADGVSQSDLISFKYRVHIDAGENNNPLSDGIPHERGVYDIFAYYTPSGLNAQNYNPSSTAEPFVLTITYADYEASLGSIVKIYDNEAPELNLLYPAPPINSTVKYSLDGVVFYDSIEALGRDIIDVCSDKDFYVLVNNYNYNNGTDTIFSSKLTINKATPVINMTQTSFEITYDRADELDGNIRSVLSLSLTGGEVYNGDYSFEYSSDSGSSWTQGLPTVVGDYTVRITPLDISSNYNSVSKDITVEVTPVDWPDDATSNGLIRIENLYNYTYDGTTPIPVIIVNDPDYTIEYSLTENGTYYSAESFSCKNSTAERPEEKITYFIRISSPNYNGYFKTHTDVSIDQRPIGLDYTDNFQSSCYNRGSAVAIGEPRLTNLASGDNLILDRDYTITYEYCDFADKNNPSAVYTQGLPVNIGNYYVKAYYNGLTTLGKNYKPTEASFHLYVYPEYFSGISAEDLDVSYDGLEHSINVTGAPLGSVIEYSTSINGTYSTTPIVMTNVCENLVVYYKVTNPNYSTEDGFNYYLGNATITIRKASPTISFTTSSRSMTYTGNTPELVAQAKLGDRVMNDVTILYTYKEKGATGVNEIIYEGLPVQAGEYEIRAYVPELENYNTAECVIDYTINKAPFTEEHCVVPEDITLTYDGGNALHIPFENVPDETLILYSFEEDGEYKAMLFTSSCATKTVYFKATNPNLSGEKTGSFNLTINKATPSISGASCTEITYGSELSSSKITASAYFTDSRGYTRSVSGSFMWLSPSSIVSAGNVSSYGFIFIPSDSNYSSVTGTLTPSVKKSEISIIFNDTMTEFTGKEISPEALDISTSPVEISLKSLKYSYRLYGTNASFTDGLPQNIGVYEVKAELESQSYYSSSVTAKVQIFSKDVEIKEYEGKYDSKPHSIKITAANGIIVEYKKAGEDTYSSINPEFTDIGVYTVEYKLTFPDGKIAYGASTVTILTDHKIIDDNVIIEITEGNSYIDEKTSAEISVIDGLLNVILPNGLIWRTDCENAVYVNNLDFFTRLVESKNKNNLRLDIIFSRVLDFDFEAEILIPINEYYADKEISLFRIKNGKLQKLDNFEVINNTVCFSLNSTKFNYALIIDGAGDEAHDIPITNGSDKNNVSDGEKNPETGVHSELLTSIICASSGFTVAGLSVYKRKHSK